MLRPDFWRWNETVFTQRRFEERAAGSGGGCGGQRSGSVWRGDGGCGRERRSLAGRHYARSSIARPGRGARTAAARLWLALSLSEMPMTRRRILDSGAGGPAIFRRREIFFRLGRWRLTTATGGAVDLPHDWAIELPFTNDPALASKGFLSAGTDVSGDERGLVPAGLRASCGGRGQADHD